MATAKQIQARKRFKEVVAEAKKLRAKNPKLTQAQAVKQAWAIEYSVAGKTKTKKQVRSVGETNSNITSKMANNLADQLVDKLDQTTFEDLVDVFGVMCGIARDARWSYGQTKLALRTLAEQFVDEYRNDFDPHRK